MVIDMDMSDEDLDDILRGLPFDFHIVLKPLFHTKYLYFLLQIYLIVILPIISQQRSMSNKVKSIVHNNQLVVVMAYKLILLPTKRSRKNRQATQDRRCWKHRRNMCHNLSGTTVS